MGRFLNGHIRCTPCQRIGKYMKDRITRPYILSRRLNVEGNFVTSQLEGYYLNYVLIPFLCFWYTHIIYCALHTSRNSLFVSKNRLASQPLCSIHFKHMRTDVCSHICLSPASCPSSQNRFRDFSQSTFRGTDRHCAKYCFIWFE